LQTASALQKKNGGIAKDTTITEQPSSDENYKSHEKRYIKPYRGLRSKRQFNKREPLAITKFS